MKILNKSIEMVEISSIQSHPRNPRVGNIGKIKESIEVNGFYGTIVVQRSTRYILAGNHRWIAAKESGALEVPVVFVDLDDSQAMRVLLADNRTSDLGEYLENELAEILQELSESEEGLLGTGWEDEDLASLLNNVGEVILDDPRDHWTGLTDYEHEDKTSWKKVIVHFRNEEDLKAFAIKCNQTVTNKTKSIWFPKMENDNVKDYGYEIED